MKTLRSRILFALSLLLLTCSACAAGGGYTGPGASRAPGAGHGGYTGPGPVLSTVEETKKMRDDSLVTLRGTIERHLGKDKYLFRDATGSITVDIDPYTWRGQAVGAADQVEIQGEVDKDWNSVEIEVDRLTKLAR